MPAGRLARLATYHFSDRLLALSMLLLLGVEAQCYVFPTVIHDSDESGGIRAEATNGGLVVEKGGKKAHLTACSGLQSNAILKVRVADGNVYFTQKGKGLWVYNTQTKKLKSVLPAGRGWVTAFDVDGGAIYFSEVGKGMHKLEGGKVKKLEAVPDFMVKTITVITQGFLVFSSDTGHLYTMKNDTKVRKIVKNIYPMDVEVDGDLLNVSTIFKTCSVTFEGEIKMCNLTAPIAAQVSDANHITSLATYNGELYVGTFDAGLHVFSKGRLERIYPDITFINALAVFGTRLLVGTRGGLYVIEGENLVDRLHKGSGLIGSKINGITICDDRVVLAMSEG
ncbi:MAG: hypothetical protein ABIJ56_13385, partial [Pseudomonadota bacterium]